MWFKKILFGVDLMSGVPNFILVCQRKRQRGKVKTPNNQKTTLKVVQGSYFVLFTSDN